jgi:hypothetical protein
MTTETYQELFYYAAFPVFAALRSTGRVIYKNLACEKYLPKLSKRNSLKSLIFSQNFDGVGPVKLAELGVYHTAIAFEDGKNSVFLFLSRLQYETGMYHGDQIFRQFGPSLTDFISAVRTNQSLKSADPNNATTELYTETVQALLDERDLGLSTNASLYKIASCVFEKLNSFFTGFGYHVNAQIAERFPQYLKIRVPMQEILFVMGRLLYLQMKLSKTKDINIFLFCNLAFSHYTFQLTTATNLSELPSDKEWFFESIPECAMEFSLLYKAKLLREENFDMKMDRPGNLTVFYNIPYISPETYYVRSMDMRDVFILQSVDNMIESLRAKLTNGEMCC